MRTLLLLLLLSFCGFVKAQVSGNLLYDNSNRLFFQQAEQPVKATIQGDLLMLEVNAMINATADSYLAIFHLTQVGQTAVETDSLMNQRINGFTKRLKALGLKEKDVFVDMLNFVPVYQYDTVRRFFSTTYTEVPAGFEIQKNVHVKFTDARILDKIVSAATLSEIYDLVKVDYFVGDQSACYDTLRTMATKLMKRKIAQFKELGLDVEASHRTGSEKNGAYFPLERYQNYSSNTRMSINSQRKGMGRMLDTHKPKTLFYNKVPYSAFDIVLHAEITEPPVQFTYNMVVYLKLPAEVPQKEVKEVIKQKFVWLSGDGVVKELPMVP